MKLNKGFTLIEILAVVTIIGLIFILAIPKITTSLKNKKDDVDRTTENMILSATKLYVSEHSSRFEKTDGNVSCIPLHQLVKKEYLDGPVKNVTDDFDITNGWSVRITYDNGFKYELVDSKECSVVYNEAIRDNDGNKYTSVVYIKSTGTQYIDTGYKPNQDTKVEVDMSLLKARTEFYFGAREGYQSSDLYTFLQYSDKFRSDYGAQNGNYLTINDSRINVIKDKNITKINDSITSSTNYNNFTSNYNMYIFAVNEKNSPITPSEIELYSFKIYNNNVLVRDYIPVMNIDNRPCLFDKVERRCYYNAGTGEFEYLSYDYTKNNKEYKDSNGKSFYEVEYLESSGTQYINTKVNATSNITIDTEINGDYSDSSWYGGRDSNYIGIYNYKGRFDYVGIDTDYINPTVGSWHKISHGKKLVIDDVLIKAYNDKQYETKVPIYLFAGNNNGGVLGNSSIKMKKTTIKNGNNIVRDYIPVIDSTSRPCLFDKVEKKCYYNQGNREFLWG